MKESRKNIIQNEIEEDPGNPFNYYLLALELYKEGDWEESKKVFGEIIHQFPDYLPVYYTFSEKLIDKNTELEFAEILIKKGIELAIEQKNNKAQRELQALLDIHF